MTRHGIEAEVLLASVASHPLGRFETLSPDEFQMLCRDMHGAFPDVVRRSLPGGIELGVARCLSKRAEIDLSTPEPIRSITTGGLMNKQRASWRM